MTRAPGPTSVTVSLAELGLAGDPQPADRLLETRPDARVERRERVTQRLPRHRDVGLLDAVELRGVLLDRLDAPVPDVVADRAHHVAARPRRRSRRAAPGCGSRGGAGSATPQVDPANHAPSLGGGGRRPGGGSARGWRLRGCRGSVGWRRDEQLPLFPLNTVLFPGVVTPLHVFEDRYRALVRDLRRHRERLRPGLRRDRDPRGLRGRRPSAMQSLHRVGTLVQLTEVEPYEDGRFDIEVIGRQRLRLHDFDTSGAYLRRRGRAARRTPTSREAVAEAERTLATFETYRRQLSELRGGPVLAGDMPARPGVPLLRPGQPPACSPCPSARRCSRPTAP